MGTQTQADEYVSITGVDVGAGDGKCTAEEQLPEVSIQNVAPTQKNEIFRESGGKPDKYILLLLKEFISAETYNSWVNKVNFDGTRGKYGLPRKVRTNLDAFLEHRFMEVIEADKIKTQVNTFLCLAITR